MRIILTWLALAVVGVAAPEAGKTNREARLEQVKAAFPRCLAVLNERTDPQIEVCYRRWKTKAESVTVESLAEDVVSFREDLHNELRNLYIQQNDAHRILRSDTKAAIRKNMTWLRTKVSPWINRLASLQQGR